MRRRKIWYKRYLFKNHFKSYKDWDEFNPPCDFKHDMRYRSDALTCRSAECPREQMPISEHEAYYYFAKPHFRKKLVLKIISGLIFRQSNGMRLGNCYICPFCGGIDVEEFTHSSVIIDPRMKFYRRKQKGG